MTIDIPQNIETVSLPLAKRFFDIIVSTLLLIILSPVILLILFAMVIEMILIPHTRGPFFYRETRISEGKPFIIYKFRIFTKEALKNAKNSNGVIHTKVLEHTKNTTTFIGNLLKQVYMDELPQLWNVLSGDMTLVGPRPTNPENIRNLLNEKRYAKLKIKAGLTGYFQSHKGVSLQKDQETIDEEYIAFIEHNPGWKIVLYDVKILLISILTIFRAEGI